MFIKYSDIVLNVDTVINNPASSQSLFLIHGFTGSSNDWLNVVHDIDKHFNIYMVDLPGHGRSDSPDDIFLYTAESISEQLKEIIRSVNSVDNIICGYSMGGRAALSFAVKNNAMLKGLVLESSSAGIAEAELREERIEKDEALASFIEEKSIDTFVDYWMSLDMFNTQRRFSEEKRSKIRDAKLCNNKKGLTNSLRGFGAGIMPPLYEEIRFFDTRTLLISGELDTKYTEINSVMVKIIPNAEHIIIKNSGHNTHLEEPQKFISVLNNFLKQL